MHRSCKNLKHVCLPRIEVIKGTTGKIKRKLTSFHWDEGRNLEKLGFVKMKNVQELAGGMYKADIWIDGVFKGEKTFFPSHWDFDTLLSKIQEACKGAHSAIINTAANKIEITGVLPEGFEVVIKLDLEGSILTVYPQLVGS